MGFLKLIQIPSSERQKIETVNDGRTMEEKVLDFRKCPTWYYKQLLTKKKRGEKRQTDLATLLCQKANVSSRRRLSIRDIAAFGKHTRCRHSRRQFYRWKQIHTYCRS